MSRLSALVAGILSLGLLASPLTAEASQSHKKHTTRTATTSKAKASKAKVAAAPARKAKASKVVISKRPQGGRVTRVSAQPSTLPSALGALRSPALYSSAAVVVNAISGERIYEKNSQAQAPIASITKLMTAIVTLDMHLPLDEPITITEEDVDTLKNSSSRLLVGTTLSRGEIMHLALMSSENRAAHALARTAPGGKAAFVAKMNRTAQSLGMQNTRFEDPTGLTSANVSTANDLIRLVQAAHHYPEIRAYSTSEEYSFISSVNGRGYTFHNTNPLVKNVAWEIGVSKTGYISEAGKCLVMQATINETPVVIVLLDSAGKLTRIGDAQRIKKWLETSPGAMLHAG
ncbi:D-alanyl-D-alanine carboxypeptidase family protein [Chitinimonas sp.]|uniref:D-alanyl-D-alanine carboxypeptidase family protein n=1 Tax=Chitinimonas sp. TaxID=1934313 RepID=UPI002F957AF4